MYYKNKENQPYFEPSQKVIEKDNLVEITEEEFNQIIIDINTPTPEQVLEQQKAEALKYLADTDWVEVYKIRHNLGLELIPEYSSKWEILNKREVYKLFLKEAING